jgi:hypothetical protein
MIWDDKAGANSKLSVKERNAKKAMHIVCEKGRQQDTAAFVRGWLKSKVGRAFTNLPMKFIPNFSKGQGIAYNSKFSHAVQKHMKLTAFGTRHSLTYEFSDLDTRCDMLEGSPSLRELILSMRTRPKPAPANGSTPPTPTPVFLSIDPNTRHSECGSFVATYTVDNAEEAEEKLCNLLSYLSHEYGDSASYWFSATAIERADNMAWDDEQQRPITTEELDLDALLDDDLDWIANVEEAQKTFQPTVEVTLERPSILRKVSNNPMAPRGIPRKNSPVWPMSVRSTGSCSGCPCNCRTSLANLAAAAVSPASWAFLKAVIARCKSAIIKFLLSSVLVQKGLRFCVYG